MSIETFVDAIAGDIDQARRAIVEERRLPAPVQPPVLARGPPQEFAFTSCCACAQKIRLGYGVNRVVGCTCDEPRQPETRRFTWHARQRYMDGDVGSDLAATARKDSEEKHDSGAEVLRQSVRSEPWDPSRGPTATLYL